MLTELKQKLAPEVAGSLAKTSDEVFELFETPKQLDHGHVAIPVFFLAREWRKAPPIIAKELAEKLTQQGIPQVKKVEPVGGYLNFHFEWSYIQQVLTQAVFAGDTHDNTNSKHQSDKAKTRQLSTSMLGKSAVGKGKKVVIDFSSPNVAKPMHIGHLRATMIGQAIYNLAQTQGYEVIGLNHLGDWGVQFGKLAWAYQQWGSEFDFKNDPFESLYQLYVRFHAEAEKNPELDQLGSLEFKKLEEGDPEIKKLWERFIEISMNDYRRLWGLLGVQHDLVRGESFYNDRLKPTEKLIEDKGLLKESDGAMVVEMDGDLPPCLIRKSDGASLYATRDVASAIYRAEELGADLSLYVVGEEQTLHFKQVFQVIKKMGYPWADQCHHISFGRYQFKDQDAKKMSSRTGNIIRLEDVLVKAIESVEQIIAQKNPDLEDKKTIARQVGVGAIIFNDLKNERVKNVDFDWDKVLDFDGDSGPYVQYVVVRCKSLIRKYQNEIPKEFPQVLESKEEKELLRQLLNYSEVLQAAFRNFKPNLVAGYLLEVCRAFNQFYHKHKILAGEEKWIESRMVLVKTTTKVLEAGLSVLNIESPEAM